MIRCMQKQGWVNDTHVHTLIPTPKSVYITATSGTHAPAQMLALSYRSQVQKTCSEVRLGIVYQNGSG